MFYSHFRHSLLLICFIYWCLLFIYMIYFGLIYSNQPPSLTSRLFNHHILTLHSPPFRLPFFSFYFLLLTSLFLFLFLCYHSFSLSSLNHLSLDNILALLFQKNPLGGCWESASRRLRGHWHGRNESTYSSTYIWSISVYCSISNLHDHLIKLSSLLICFKLLSLFWRFSLSSTMLCAYGVHLITFHISYYRVRSVNSKSFIIGSEFVFSSLKKTESVPIMKLLLSTERTHHLILHRFNSYSIIINIIRGQPDHVYWIRINC